LVPDWEEEKVCFFSKLSQGIRKRDCYQPGHPAETLAENIYLHTGFHTLSGFGRVSGNGLLVVSGTSAALIDTPWTDELTAVLFDWVKKELGARIETVIPTHSHVVAAAEDSIRRLYDPFSQLEKPGLHERSELGKLAGSDTDTQGKIRGSENRHSRSW
jgi:hypothetical protein